MMNLLMELRMRVQTLQLCMQAACDAAFLVESADNPVAAEEHLRALSVHLRAMVIKAICQGAAMSLAAAQLHIGAVVNIQGGGVGFFIGIEGR